MFINFKNRPPHVYLDNYYYFLVSKTIGGQLFFNTFKKKQIILTCLGKSLKKFNFTCQSWVILNNHYQIVIKTDRGVNLQKFIAKMNSESARILNSWENCRGRKIWWNYWDACLSNKKSFWIHINYNHHNPVKHGYVDKPEEYYFSSYRLYLKNFGNAFLNELWLKYPIVDFTINYD